MNIYSIKNKKKIMEMRYLRTFEGFSSIEKTDEAFMGGLRPQAVLKELLGKTRNDSSFLDDEKNKKTLKDYYDQYIQRFNAKLASQYIPSVISFLNGKTKAADVVPAEVALCVKKAKQIGLRKDNNEWEDTGLYGGDEGAKTLTGEGGAAKHDPNDYIVMYPTSKK
jgi:hypothetical protein